MLKIFEPILRIFRLPSIDEVERDYLNEAFSLDNLEYRQDQIDAGMFRKPVFPSVLQLRQPL